MSIMGIAPFDFVTPGGSIIMIAYFREKSNRQNHQIFADQISETALSRKLGSCADASARARTGEKIKAGRQIRCNCRPRARKEIETSVLVPRPAVPFTAVTGLGTQSLGSHLYPAQQDSARWGHGVGRSCRLLVGLTRLSWVSPAGVAIPSLALYVLIIPHFWRFVKTFFRGRSTSMFGGFRNLSGLSPFGYQTRSRS